MFFIKTNSYIIHLSLKICAFKIVMTNLLKLETYEKKEVLYH